MTTKLSKLEGTAKLPLCCSWHDDGYEITDADGVFLSKIHTTGNNKLRGILGVLLEQIDCLDGVTLSRDLEPHEAEEIWESVLAEAKKVYKETA